MMIDSKAFNRRRRDKEKMVLEVGHSRFGFAFLPIPTLVSNTPNPDSSTKAQCIQRKWKSNDDGWVRVMMIDDDWFNNSLTNPVCLETNHGHHACALFSQTTNRGAGRDSSIKTRTMDIMLVHFHKLRTVERLRLSRKELQNGAARCIVTTMTCQDVPCHRQRRQ